MSALLLAQLAVLLSLFVLCSRHWAYPALLALFELVWASFFFLLCIVALSYQELTLFFLSVACLLLGTVELVVGGLLLPCLLS
jgi:hypothetical protein